MKLTPEEAKAKAAAYFQERYKDPEYRKYRLEKRRAWSYRKRERYLELAKRDRQKHHTRVMRNNRKREILERDAEGHHTVEEWNILKKIWGYKCVCCGKAEPEIKLTRDHVVPLVQGGSNNIDNIQPLCVSCNSGKYLRRISYVA